MTSSYGWVLNVGIGVGILLIGSGVLLVCLRLAGLIKRFGTTLDIVDERLGALSIPVTETLSHVAGIAGKADSTIGRLGGIMTTLEGAAGTLSRTASATSDALTPSITNIGATLTKMTSGMQRLIRRNGGKHE